MKLLLGDALDQLRTLPAGVARCCVTSPPYFGLRDYGMAGQLGAEATPDEYAVRLVAVMREVRRVLTDDGTLWLNLGDSYATTPSGTPQRNFNGDGYDGGRGTSATSRRGDGMRQGVPAGTKPKDLLGIPWLVAFALRADGWYLRSEIIWHKPNAMPESVTDRPTRSHETVFLLAKGARYYYDAAAIAEPTSQPRGLPWLTGQHKRGALQSLASSTLGTNQGAADRNKRDVWTVATRGYPGAHFATMPPALVRPCILAGSAPGDTVLDPFVGSGTTLAVAKTLGRDGLGIDLNPEYLNLARARLDGAQPPLFTDWLEPMAAD